LGPVSVPPHGWPEPTPAPRRCPRSQLQQDTGTVPRGAETPRGRSQLQHPAGRDSTPSPMHQTPLPNRPINECGTGACYGSLERRVSCLSPLVLSLCSELIAALQPHYWVLAAASARRGVSQAFRSYRRSFIQWPTSATLLRGSSFWNMVIPETVKSCGHPLDHPRLGRSIPFLDGGHHLHTPDHPLLDPGVPLLSLRGVGVNPRDTPLDTPGTPRVPPGIP
jgi:hypothetical protein